MDKSFRLNVGRNSNDEDLRDLVEHLRNRIQVLERDMTRLNKVRAGHDAIENECFYKALKELFGRDTIGDLPRSSVEQVWVKTRAMMAEIEYLGSPNYDPEKMNYQQGSHEEESE